MTPAMAKKVFDLLEMQEDLSPEQMEFCRTTGKRPFRELYPEDLELLRKAGVAIEPLEHEGIVKPGQIMQYKIDVFAVAEMAQKARGTGEERKMS